MFVQSVGGALFVVGLAPVAPPPFLWRVIPFTLSLIGVLVVAAWARLLLPLIEITSLLEELGFTSVEELAHLNFTVLPGLTPWHWALSAIPLALGVAAVAGSGRQYRAGAVSAWLLVAMVVLAGSHLHNLFWPSGYSPILTSSHLLRLAFAAVVAAGGTLELHRIASERAAMLAVEQEHSRRLGELAELREDFTAMVVHELGSPLAAIRGFADILSTKQLSPEAQARALAVIRTETSALTTLVADMQLAAGVERDDFRVRLQPVALNLVLADASAFAESLPGDHPFRLTVSCDQQISVDRERIDQVLRNLLHNAAKYSPDGAPIKLRAIPDDGRVRIEVADQGYGIHPDEVGRIFEKFGRGRDNSDRAIPGTGLGLYLSRQIVRAHGGDLTVDSTVGVGSVFAFELEVVA